MIFKLHIQSTLQKLLAQEDTDGDKKITIDDNGPKSFELIDQNHQKHSLKGTYFLSNLLQELALANKSNSEFVLIDLANIEEKPVDRISRKIKEYYWNGLTRTIDQEGLSKIIEDEKTSFSKSYLYVPFNEKKAFAYFKKLETKFQKLEVIQLPQKITPEYVLSLNKKPGILALQLNEENNQFSGEPFLVPGGRFNEMYGWDSYFIGLGLVVDGKIELAKSIAENFKYQIKNYGKILNGNRSYYLDRTQPPLYSTLIVDILNHSTQENSWIQEHLQTIVDEYFLVWMDSETRLTPNGLNRYKAQGVGMPFEVEKGHFDEVFEKFCSKYKLTTQEIEEKYLNRELHETALDDYFVHDRSMRESGHDTSSRFINVCANLNTVDLNSLLYKYETDIAFIIKKYCDDDFSYKPNKSFSSNDWIAMANKRKTTINQLSWNQEQSIYYDYNFVTQKQHLFESATTFYPLWAKLCSQEQATLLVKTILPKFKLKGGITGSTQESAIRNDDMPDRQWDYPYGWAPHQILLWQGLLNYNFMAEAQEMAYRWLWLITKNAVDYNGTIPEKFDLETSSHKVFAEYGNVGTEFDYITEEGFGWMNASYQYGLSILPNHLKEQLSIVIDPDDLFER